MGQVVGRKGLADRVVLARPRLLLMAAGPGWGKTYLSKELAAKATSPEIVSPSGVSTLEEATALVRPALEALKKATNDLLVIDDADRLVELGGAALLDQLMAAARPETMLVFNSVLPIDAIAPSRHFAPHEFMTLRRDAFEFSPEESREVIGESYLSTALLERAVTLAQGWPISMFLFARLARDGKLEEALADPSSWLLDPYHQYFKDRVLSRLLPEENETFAAIAALDEGTVDEISAALGKDARPALLRIEKYRYALVVFHGGSYSLTSMPEGAMLALYSEEIKTMRVRAARELHERGKHVRAAGLALGAGDYALATECLDAAGRRNPGEVLSADYYRVAERLPLDEVFRSRYVFLDLLCNRRVRARPFPLFNRVRDFCESLTRDSEPIVRFSARVAYTSLLRQTLQAVEAEAQAIECEKLVDRFPDAHDRRALLRAERAVIAAYRGRLDDAESIWSEADALADPAPGWFEDHRWAIDVVQAICRGDGRAVRSLMDANVQAARLWDDSACLSQAITFSTICCSLAAPDEDVSHIEQQLRIVAERTDEVLDPVKPFVGDPFAPPTGWVGHSEALAALFAAFGQTDVDLARRLIGECLAVCDRIGHGYMQIAVRLAGTVALGSERSRFVAECASIARRMQAPLVLAQIDAVAKNQALPGPYSAFLNVLGSARLVGARSVIRVRMLDRKVTRDGKDLRVRQREFELLAHLALAGAPVSVEALCEAIWPDYDESAAISSLRMSVHRLRKQLDDPAAVLNATGGYQLASSITVDVLEAESAFVALRRLPQLNDDDRSALHALFQYVCSLGGDVGVGQSWYERIERRIEDLRHGAGILLAKEYLRIGEALAAQEVAEMLLRLDPLDEEAVGLCVKALTAANDKTAATRLWHQYVKRLSSDYGTKPSVSIHELVGAT